METFTKPREFVENARFSQDRQASLAALDLDSIDRPIVDIAAGFTALPHCFTLQCCYGHFLCTPDQDSYNLEPIPASYSDSVKYRIAYIAFCIENSPRGQAFRQASQQSHQATSSSGLRTGFGNVWLIHMLFRWNPSLTNWRMRPSWSLPKRCISRQ